MRFFSIFAITLPFVASIFGASLERRQDDHCVVHTYRKQERWGLDYALGIDNTNDPAKTGVQIWRGYQEIDGMWFEAELKVDIHNSRKVLRIKPSAKNNQASIPDRYKFKFDITLKDGEYQGTISEWLESNQYCIDAYTYSARMIDKVTFSYKTG